MLLLAGAMLAPAADTRLEALRTFLQKYPGRVYAQDFLEAADRYDLDWTLLPSICVAETGCGITAKRNNMFGWKSGRKRFYSRRQGIYYIASRIAHSARYQEKTTSKQLKAYNPQARRYPARVMDLMRTLRKLNESVKE